ncbi:MAG: alpha/beta fold hydrolase [Gemmatimonadetes bacterium]|nr:alpha/beta fold hydrolase [Gemmatimonadota bacterium]
MNAKERFLAFRRAAPRAPHLEHATVRARGLDFAVFSTPPVAGTTPLLCINGGMVYSHILLWPALSSLAARRQLILYDLRGRGRSQVPPGARAARIEHDALDVRALREALGLPRWDVLGHSWGGAIAMLGAAEDPDGVGNLVLVDAVGLTPEWLDALHDVALARLSGEAHDRLAAFDPRQLHDPEPARQAEYNRALYPAWFHDGELGAMFSPPLARSDTGAAVVARLRREGFDWRDNAARIRARTLLVHGTSDLIPVAQAERTAATIADARLHLILDAGHMPFWEQPEQFFAAVEEFLT